MGLHLLKLCVGVEAPEELARWQVKRRLETGREHPVHITRMWPRRESELLDGGSLYWVMKGLIRARQQILGMSEVIGEDGIARCAISLKEDLVLTDIVPRRAFQGWRYLAAKDAPADLMGARGGLGDIPLPETLQLALGEIGVR